MNQAKKRRMPTVRLPESRHQRNKPQGDERLALSLVRTPGGWCVVRYTIVGDRVVKEEYSEPELLSITQEKFRLECEEHLAEVRP